MLTSFPHSIIIAYSTRILRIPLPSTPLTHPPPPLAPHRQRTRSGPRRPNPHPSRRPTRTTHSPLTTGAATYHHAGRGVARGEKTLAAPSQAIDARGGGEGGRGEASKGGGGSVESAGGVGDVGCVVESAGGVGDVGCVVESAGGVGDVGCVVESAGGVGDVGCVVTGARSYHCHHPANSTICVLLLIDI